MVPFKADWTNADDAENQHPQAHNDLAARLNNLSNVDNTADANKPVSTATQTALNAKTAVGSATPAANISGGTVGTSPNASREDHAHPTTGLIRTSTVTAKGDLLTATGSGAVTRRAVGANDTVLMADSAQSDGVKWATVPKVCDVQIFTANGTWTKPAGAVSVDVLLVGPGTGGASGRRGAAGTVRQGGGGGSSGGVSRQQIPAIALPSTVAVTIGLGTAGGAAVTTDDTNGAPAGQVTTVSTFGTYVKTGTNQAVPASTQGGGTGAGGAPATAGSGTSSGAAGATASSTGSVGGSAAAIASGAAGSGGAGGGITSANVASNGGAGGNNVITVSITQTGGVVDGALPLVATAQPVNSGLPGHGGGGGAASITQAAQAGADGGLYGGAGGGGGASLNGFDSGKGGDGANGIAIITTYF